MNQPTIKWGPALPENRTIPRYQRLLQLDEDSKTASRKIEEAVNKANTSSEDTPPTYSSLQDNPSFQHEDERNNVINSKM